MVAFKNLFYQKPVVVPLVILILLQQVGLTEITLSRATFSYSSAPVISDAKRLSRGLRSHSFRMKRGGVAFGESAVGIDGLKVTNIKYLKADSKGQQIEDGERLYLQVSWPDGRKQTVVAPIYDWELIPIAKFADSDTDSCFTLFGELHDESERLNDARVMNYHPAFVDTLLGLRLMQADIILFDENATDLPGEPDSVNEGNINYLLGAGEEAPDLTFTEQVFEHMQQFLVQLSNDSSGITHESYVICDEGQQVTVAVREGLLVLTGQPYWSCSRSEPMLQLLTKDDLLDVAQQIQQFEAEYRSQLYTEYAAEIASAQKEPDADHHMISTLYRIVVDSQVRSMVAGSMKKFLISRCETILGSRAEELLDEEYEADKESLSEEQLNAKWDRAYAVNRLGELSDELLSEAILRLMPIYSDRLTDQIRQQKGINPVVYSALVKTMRYAALFRHVKEQAPEEFAAFLESIEDVPALPEVRTPTQMVSPSAASE